MVKVSLMSTTAFGGAMSQSEPSPTGLFSTDEQYLLSRLLPEDRAGAPSANALRA